MRKNIPRIRNTSQRIIPRQKRRKDAKIPTGLDQLGIIVALGIRIQMSEGQEQESQIEREEQHEERHGGFQRADQQDGREDEPAGEEVPERVVEVVDAVAGRCPRGVGGAVGFYDLETAGCEDDGEGEPETAVGGEGGGSEGVAYCHFPGKYQRSE